VADQYSILVACHSEPIYRELKSPYIEICSTTSEQLEIGYEHYANGVPGLNSRPESFSELAVLFNAEPYIDAKKLVGFVHYRRIFSLNPSDNLEPVIDVEFSHRFSRANLEASFLELYLDTIVIPLAWDQNRNLLQDFTLRHSILQDALKIACSEFDIHASKIFGEANSISVLSSTNKIYPCNMWIGNEDFYREWTSLIYPVLKKIETSSLVLPTKGYQARWAGFITERLFTVYINLCQHAGKWNFTERPILLFVENSNTQHTHAGQSIHRILLYTVKLLVDKVRQKTQSSFSNLVSK
jgi:hypothetical protein